MDLIDSVEFIDIIDLDILCDVQNKLAKLVDVPTITVDNKGNPVGVISNFTPFCNLIRSSKGASKCIDCDARAGLIAVRERKSRIYTCHTGLIDCVSPIIVNGYFLGSVLGGQVLIEGEQTAESIDIERISKEFEIPIESLRETLKYTPIVSREYLQDYVSFYNLLSNLIARMGMHRLTEKKLLAEIEKRSKLEEYSKKMELKTISAQMHPHFLFNTLNTIARMSLIEGAPQTEQLIYMLSDLLRYNLKNVQHLPSIREEIDNIKRYLYIQTLRYNDRISYEINIDESIMDYKIPSMILQPIVENSMIHGLEPKEEGGKIIITGKALSDDELLITVHDNGMGVSPETLKEINALNNLSDDIGIGIANTNGRIRHIFGEKYGLKILSKLNTFTESQITIPIII